MCDFKRGDVVFVENPIQEAHGHVVAGNHPAVVIQNDMGNKFGILKANIEVGINHPEIGEDLKEYIKEIAGKL